MATLATQMQVHELQAGMVLAPDEAHCANCGEQIKVDPNGAGGFVLVHLFGSTVCHDDPPGSLEDGDTTTTAELRPEPESERSRTVVYVQVLGPISIIDFADGTATPPINSSAIANVEQEAP